MAGHESMGINQYFGAREQFGTDLDSVDVMAAPHVEAARMTQDFILSGALSDERAADLASILGQAKDDFGVMQSIAMGCQSAFDQEGYRDNPEATKRLSEIYGQIVPKAEKAADQSTSNVRQTPADRAYMANNSWQDFANCLGVDPDMFFPERGASTREAKEVCQGCVVREECLEYALYTGEKFGIWGGMSERERRRIRRQRALARVAAQATD